MIKQKLSNWVKKLRIKSYLRELSIVIIGVAITLYAGNVITGIKEKKDIKLLLSAIYSEMEENFSEIKEVNKYNEMNSRLRYYLLESVEDPEPSTNDSIRKYENVAWTTITFTYKRDAYDMFVNSGAMKHLNDRELLLDITESYSTLEYLKIANERRMNSKMLILQDMYKLPKKDIYSEELDILSSAMNQLFNYHALYQGSEEITDKALEKIEKTLQGKLNDYKLYK